MKGQFRRSLRKLERTFSQAKSFTVSLVRSNSHYNYTRSSPPPLPPRSALMANSSDDDDNDDLVFRSASPVESSVEDNQQSSVILIPCEFCQVQQPSHGLTRHELLCSENPSYGRVRRVNRTTRTSGHRRRRAVSDSLSPIPSAPLRSRSPSVTDDVDVPERLQCPITGSIFRDPVVASDGHTYEREAINRWLLTNRISPITREPMSIDKLNPNLFVKNMVDDFRAECRRKKLLFKYKLDIDVKKTSDVPVKQTDTQTIYPAEWIRKPSSSTNPSICLVHLNGENAEKIAEVRCRNIAHPNLVRIFGRVEHRDPGILLVQECQPDETLTNFIEKSLPLLSVHILDKILNQILSVLEYLTTSDIDYTKITTEDILIDEVYDDESKDISIKLTNIGDIEKRISNSEIGSEAPSRINRTEKANIYAFGAFAKEVYSLLLKTDAGCLKEREALFKRCLVNDLDERPSFIELKDAFSKFVNEDKSKLY